MALWLVRGGKHGEHEARFLEENRIYATWEGLKADLGRLADRDALRAVLHETYPDWGTGRLNNYASQLWPFAHVMQKGDWVVMPRRSKPAIAFAEITGAYEYHAKAEDPYYHSRSVHWIVREVPRSAFDQDLLYSFGAFMTICKIERNDAEGRIRRLGERGWNAGQGAGLEPPGHDVDLAEVGRDQIAKLVLAKFKGHGMARLVEAVLNAQGYVTWRSPEGPDKGIDILAASGPLGFASPRICVQVKSSSDPVDLPTLNQLIGAMQNAQADQGLLVSWGGFKSSVDREVPHQFFRVRLWDQDTLIDEMLRCYDSLPADLRAELPLKRMWTVASPDDDEQAFP